MPQDNKQLCKDEIYAIVGCAIDVLNGVGAGFPEDAYGKAMAIEFGERDIAFEQEKAFDLTHRDQVIGQFTTQLIAYDKVIVDCRNVERINHHDRNQMINMLKVSELEVGIVLNFKRPKLEWERVIYTRRPPGSEEETDEIYDVENDDTI